MPRPPQPWTLEELQTEAKVAKDLLRERREQEKLEKRELIEERGRDYRALLLELLAKTNDLANLANSTEVLMSRSLLDMARYTALPFVSLDDLDTMTESCFGGWVSQKTDNPKNRRPTELEFAAAAEYLARELDPFRAPWLDGDRPPTVEEREHFIRATMAVRFNSILQTRRRNAGSRRQEEAVRIILDAADYKKVKTRRDINDPITEMPERSYTSAARSLRNTSIDIPIRLPDDHPTGLRFVALEAKDTNTDINTRKRLMEVRDKAATWNSAGFPFQFRTGAVLSGSLPVNELKGMQDQGIMIFWEHRLADLVAFIHEAP
jgi:hypothetical protein